ncbi:dTMP kinase [Candidatus Peregrinibacteria bacterium]|nr:dTMP kinase [Candidatus Peregrinibacteria bacterium]
MSGFFIVFEGPDGAGTTTHSERLADALRAEGKEVLLTAEPSEGPVGKHIRDELKSHSGLSPREYQELFVNDRAWHLEHVIKPALRKGIIVISDRYIPSTLMYGASQGLPMEWLQEMNKDFLKPDVMIFTLPPFEVSWPRVAKRTEKDPFEQKDLQKKIHQAYIDMAEQDPSIHTIDTSGDKDEVAKKIRSFVTVP